MNFNEGPKKKNKIKINLLAAMVGFVLCFGVGFWVGNSKNKIIDTQNIENNKVFEVYEILKNKWLNTNDPIDLDEVLVKAMVTAVGDKYNSYFTQSDLADFQDSINKNYEGIGVAFNVSTGVPIITNVYVGSQAEKAGLQKGDILLEANHQSLDGLSSEEIANLVKGESGTSVLLKIKRGEQELEISVVRAAIDYSALYEIKQSNGKNYGLITLSSFGTTTAMEVEKALEYFKSQNIDTIVLDLRDNPGGYLQAAKGILDLFISEGQTEFITENKDGKQTAYVSDNKTPYQFASGFILMNGSSASASEVVAGALQELLDYQVIGTQSYGKGVAQDQATLSDLSVVKYTYAKWLLPSGKWIDHEGIKPDIEVHNLDTSELYSFELEEPLKVDTVDERIIQMQKMLKLLGYDIDREDGYFSEKTRECLIEFEKKHQLSQDGEFDNEDKKILISDVVQFIYDENNDQQYKTLETLIK